MDSALSFAEIPSDQKRSNTLKRCISEMIDTEIDLFVGSEDNSAVT